MKKILCTYTFDSIKNEKLASLGVSFIQEKSLKQITFNEYHAIICNNPFGFIDIEQSSNLEWIQLVSSGIDRLPENISSTIKVTNAKSPFSIPIAEYTIGKILEVYKNSRDYYANQVECKWTRKSTSRSLFNKTIGIIGTGSIGCEIAKRFQGFNCKVIGFNTTGTEKEYFDVCKSIVSIKDDLPYLDIIIIAAPHTEDTHALIDLEKMELLKSNAVLLNVSRGQIVVEDDLVQHLLKNTEFTAVLDVFVEEPLSEKSPLWQLENVLITPHISFQSEYRNEWLFN